LYTCRQLLANLWARGAALQCCFCQEAIDVLIPSYHGSVDPNSKFDPNLLSAIAGQFKNKVAGDKQAELAIRPIGVFRDPRQPLPYLALLMELGTESRFIENGSMIKCTASEPRADDEFEILCDALRNAEMELHAYRRKMKMKKETLAKFREKVNDARLAADSCNRFSISVRGASPDVYGILEKANIANEFATLLSIVMPSPGGEHSARQHMRPLERLSKQAHTAWMWEYGVSHEEWQKPM